MNPFLHFLILVAMVVVFPVTVGMGMSEVAQVCLKARGFSSYDAEECGSGLGSIIGGLLFGSILFGFAFGFITGQEGSTETHLEAEFDNQVNQETS